MRHRTSRRIENETSEIGSEIGRGIRQENEAEPPSTRKYVCFNTTKAMSQRVEQGPCMVVIVIRVSLRQGDDGGAALLRRRPHCDQQYQDKQRCAKFVSCHGRLQVVTLL